MENKKFKYEKFNLDKYKFSDYCYDKQVIPDLFEHIQNEFERYINSIDK